MYRVCLCFFIINYTHSFLNLFLRCEHSSACIATEGGFLVNPSSRLSVRAECVADCNPENVKYEWKIYAVDETKSESIPLDDWEKFIVSKCISKVSKAHIPSLISRKINSESDP